MYKIFIFLCKGNPVLSLKSFFLFTLSLPPRSSSSSFDFYSIEEKGGKMTSPCEVLAL